MLHVWPVPKLRYRSLSDVEDDREVAIVYTQPVWNLLKDNLHLSIASQAEVREATIQHWQELGHNIRGDVIYAVGGGLAVDAAKYIAAQRRMGLVCIPTALSVDAFITWASGYRKDGCVRYIETKPPDQLIVDFKLLASAPPAIRAAGICDVLSIATGSWDWRYAHEQGRNSADTPYIPYIDQIAQGILQGALDCAEACGHGDADGLKQLLDCLVMEVQLCNLIGHSRPEEGSEHYFAYSVENIMGKGLPHGDLVGPGIVLLAGIQDQDVTSLKQAIEHCNIPMTSIPNDVIIQTLQNLPAYARHHNLPYGIAHQLTEDDLEQLPSLE